GFAVILNGGCRVDDEDGFRLFGLGIGGCGFRQRGNCGDEHQQGGGHHPASELGKAQRHGFSLSRARPVTKGAATSSSNASLPWAKAHKKLISRKHIDEPKLTPASSTLNSFSAGVSSFSLDVAAPP